MKNWLTKYLSPHLYYRAFSRALFSLYGVVIQELKVCAMQFFSFRHPFFSLFHITRQFFATIVRIPLGRSLKYSYGYTGEDRIIESILKPIITNKGFYVDVGCNHPVFHSNTFLFYKRGWRGICIDANEKLVAKHRKFRPRDTAVTSLVSDTDQEREFHIFTNDVLSTTEKHNLEYHTDLGQEITSSKMKTRSLTSILQDCKAPGEFDFLSIDVEEHDFNVLKSLDFTLYRPRLVVIELEDFSIDSPGENEVYIYMTQKGYSLVTYSWKNAYFLRELV